MSPDRDVEKSGRRRGRDGPKRPVETFISGLAVTVVFGLLMRFQWFPFPSWVFWFPMIFAGVLPMVRGLTGMVRGGVTRVMDTRGNRAQLETPPAADTGSKTDAERKILMLAREEHGVITPAIIALKTDLSLDRAGELLEDLARRGHASMQVKEDGRLEYRFPEFERPAE